MTQDELTAWATKNGWRPIAGQLSLAKPSAPAQPIVRLLFKVTVVQLEVRKPAGKWEKMASADYAKVLADPEGGLPTGLGFEKMPGITALMQDNRDAQVFSGFGKPR